MPPRTQIQNRLVEAAWDSIIAKSARSQQNPEQIQLGCIPRITRTNGQLIPRRAKGKQDLEVASLSHHAGYIDPAVMFFDDAARQRQA